MGSMATNDGVRTLRLHLTTKIREKTQTQTLSVNKALCGVLVRSSHDRHEYISLNFHKICFTKILTILQKRIRKLEKPFVGLKSLVSWREVINCYLLLL